jgi:peptidoglycan hydrolase-like protein with peptidoglycan-binding domain
MTLPATWTRQLFAAAGLSLLLCTFGIAENSSPASATKSTKKPLTHKDSSAAHHSATSAHNSPMAKSKKSSARTVSRKGKHSKQSSRRGQQKIDNPRTVQIQQALIKQHYLSGEPSGKWDASTEEALRKFQGDNGWQNKTVPDSRALIKLGLGPSHDHLLNPESAMTTSPEPRSPATVKPASGPSEGTPSNQPN